MFWITELERLRRQQQPHEDNRPVLHLPIPPYYVPEEMHPPVEDEPEKRGVIILDIFSQNDE